MMNLHFQQSYLSITSFPNIELPDFTLITGPNGAGKTHLLQALYAGYVRTDCTPNQNQNNQLEIRTFDWNTMAPQGTGAFSSESIRNERLNLSQQFQMYRQNDGLMEPIRSLIREYGLGDEYLSNPTSVLKITPEQYLSIVKDNEKLETVRSSIKHAIRQVEHNIISNLNGNLKYQITTISELLNKSIICLTENDILSPTLPSWGQSDIFQQSFSRLFVAYRDLKLANELQQFRASKGLEGIAYLTDAKFIETHGPAPWKFVNATLLEAGLDFEINQPVEDDYAPFQPTLTKKSKNVVVPFQNLSSGEKILMSFAFCVYYANDRRQLSVYPKILLFDEIDAPLHPSMSKSIINTITKTLVDSFQIKVIATTHSPSTVALAPEESIYVMSPERPGLHKSSKSEALNILTFGVPTIAISYEGRRQVFVESPIDAKAYEALYKLIKPRVASERSLEFIATGKRSIVGDKNTGCEVVKQLVTDLSGAGNISVFGLLDWDGKHESTERIAVLADGRRNGLENILFDPLLIGAAICRHHPQHKHQIGLNRDVSYSNFLNFGAIQLQEITTVVCEKVFSNPPAGIKKSRYVGGLELDVDERYFTTDDHELEGLILKAFPFLKAITKGQAGKLIEYVIDSVIADKPEFMPLDIKLVIEDLLERPSHPQP